MGIYRAAERLGLRLPRDLSVVGFDNIHGVEHLTPPLSTMNIDKEYLGAAAVRHLYDTSAQPKPPQPHDPDSPRPRRSPIRFSTRSQGRGGAMT